MGKEADAGLSFRICFKRTVDDTAVGQLHIGETKGDEFLLQHLGQHELLLCARHADAEFVRLCIDFRVTR